MRSLIAAAPEAVYDWHARPGALERLIPPWEKVRILERTGGIEDNGRVTIQTRIGPRAVRWIAQHLEFERGRMFVDEQLEGPFKRWKHTHLMQPAAGGGCMLEDRIDYEPPGGRVGRWLCGMVERRLQRMFTYRHAVTRCDLAMQKPFARVPPQRVLVSGSSGLIGSALTPLLTTAGHRVQPLVRSSQPVPHGVAWDPRTGTLDADAFEAFAPDAVVHLAADNIGQGRWTGARKQAIRDSRVDATRRLCESLARRPSRPRVLVSASAVGYYGHREDAWLDERSDCGKGFLADLCREWEAATAPAAEAGIRVVHLRLGIVLSPRGGALKRMLLPFKLGAGGPIGNGRQYYSWVSIDDAIGAVYHALMCESLEGPVNVVSPQPVMMRDFARALGRVLRRPAIAPMPAFAARLAFGDLADEALLASARVRPMTLMQSGYAPRHESLDAALRHVLGR